MHLAGFSGSSPESLPLWNISKSCSFPGNHLSVLQGKAGFDLLLLLCAFWKCSHTEAKQNRESSNRSLVHLLGSSASLISAGHLPPSDPYSTIVNYEALLPWVQCACGVRKEKQPMLSLGFIENPFIWARIRWLPLEFSLPTFWFGVGLIGILGEKQW